MVSVTSTPRAPARNSRCSGRPSSRAEPPPPRRKSFLAPGLILIFYVSFLIDEVKVFPLLVDDLSPDSKRFLKCRDFDSQYRIIQSLGEGCFSDVLLVKSNVTGKLFAIKRAKDERIQRRTMILESRTEASYGALLTAAAYRSELGYYLLQHIVRLHQAWEDEDGRLHQRLEYCVGSVQSALENFSTFQQNILNFKKSSNEGYQSLPLKSFGGNNGDIEFENLNPGEVTSSKIKSTFQPLIRRISSNTYLSSFQPNTPIKPTFKSNNNTEMISILSPSKTLPLTDKCDSFFPKNNHQNDMNPYFTSQGCTTSSLYGRSAMHEYRTSITNDLQCTEGNKSGTSNPVIASLPTSSSKKVQPLNIDYHLANEIKNDDDEMVNISPRRRNTFQKPFFVNQEYSIALSSANRCEHNNQINNNSNFNGFRDINDRPALRMSSKAIGRTSIQNYISNQQHSSNNVNDISHLLSFPSKTNSTITSASPPLRTPSLSQLKTPSPPVPHPPTRRPSPPSSSHPPAKRPRLSPQYPSSHSDIPEDFIWTILADTLLGLSLLHRVGILHLDVKPANLLVDATGRIHLGDLGSSVLVEAEEEGGVEENEEAKMPVMNGYFGRFDQELNRDCVQPLNVSRRRASTLASTSRPHSTSQKYPLTSNSRIPVSPILSTPGIRPSVHTARFNTSEAFLPSPVLPPILPIVSSPGPPVVAAINPQQCGSVSSTSSPITDEVHSSLNVNSNFSLEEMFNFTLPNIAELPISGQSNIHNRSEHNFVPITRSDSNSNLEPSIKRNLMVTTSMSPANTSHVQHPPPPPANFSSLTDDLPSRSLVSSHKLKRCLVDFVFAPLETYLYNEASSATDLFSLGLVLWSVCVGCSPPRDADLWREIRRGRDGVFSSLMGKYVRSERKQFYGKEDTLNDGVLDWMNHATDINKEFIKKTAIDLESDKNPSTKIIVEQESPNVFPDGNSMKHHAADSNCPAAPSLRLLASSTMATTIGEDSLDGMYSSSSGQIGETISTSTVAALHDDEEEQEEEQEDIQDSTHPSSPVRTNNLDLPPLKTNADVMVNRVGSRCLSFVRQAAIQTLVEEEEKGTEDEMHDAVPSLFCYDGVTFPCARSPLLINTILSLLSPSTQSRPSMRALLSLPSVWSRVVERVPLPYLSVEDILTLPICPPSAPTSPYTRPPTSSVISSSLLASNPPPTVRTILGIQPFQTTTPLQPNSVASHPSPPPSFPKFPSSPSSCAPLYLSRPPALSIPPFPPRPISSSTLKVVGDANLQQSSQNIAGQTYNSSVNVSKSNLRNSGERDMIINQLSNSSNKHHNVSKNIIQSSKDANDNHNTSTQYAQDPGYISSSPIQPSTSHLMLNNHLNSSYIPGFSNYIQQMGFTHSMEDSRLNNNNNHNSNSNNNGKSLYLPTPTISSNPITTNNNNNNNLPNLTAAHRISMNQSVKPDNSMAAKASPPQLHSPRHYQSIPLVSPLSEEGIESSPIPSEVLGSTPWASFFWGGCQGASGFSSHPRR